MVKLDVDNAKFQVDALQEEAILGYLRTDQKFLKTFHNDLTAHFFKYLLDKIKLKEPVTLGIKGVVRSGKSTIGITIACKIAELNGKQLSIRNICENEYIFLDRVKEAEENDVFVIDESKEGVFGVGSMAKRMKIHDIQNIIAKKNISTIWITPRRFNDTNSDYGLQTFGRARNVKPNLTKLLLYNLMERGGGFMMPFGYVIMPVFDDVYSYGKQLRKEYEELKDAWIEKEKESETNIMFNIQKARAEELLKIPQYLNISKLKDRIVYARSKLPSEFTKQEVEEIVRLAKMIQEGLF